MTKILNCLPRLPSRKKSSKMSFPRTQQNARVGFELRPCRLQSRRFNALQPFDV